MGNLAPALAQASRAMGLPLSDRQIQQLAEYGRLLQEWNTRINLTTITDDEAMVWKHFIDSLTPAVYVDFRPGMRVIDVGTGAGFPGLPLKVWQPDLKMLLFDSVKKKIGFVAEVIRQLGLSECEAVWGRAEELARQTDYRDGFDRALARAVAGLNVLAEYCLPFVKVGGVFIAQKGPEARREVAEAATAVAALGGEVADIFDIELGPGRDRRALVVIKKVTPTPPEFPRRVGLAEKRPL